MNKLNWKKSSGSLRKLLKTLKTPHNSSNRTEYKFGICYDNRYQYFVLWNGLSRNIVATFKFTSNRLVVRYRKNSYYRDIIKKLSVVGFKTIFIESNNLHRHRALPRQRLQRDIEHNLGGIEGTMIADNEIPVEAINPFTSATEQMHIELTRDLNRREREMVNRSYTRVSMQPYISMEDYISTTTAQDVEGSDQTRPF